MDIAFGDKRFPLGKIILWIWALVATGYIGWQYVQAYAYQTGYVRGQNDIVAAVVQQASDPATCQRGITVGADGKTVLLPVSCLQQQQAAVQQGAAQPGAQPAVPAPKR